MTDIAARLRILEELHAAAMREWPNLPPEDHATALLCLAADRIHRGETRGYTRRRPAQPAALDVTKLQIGID